jgi:hypothetical protein
MKDLCKDEWKIIPSELSNVAPQLKKKRYYDRMRMKDLFSQLDLPPSKQEK